MKPTENPDYGGLLHNDQLQHTNTHSTASKIAIVGCGVSGIVSARVLKGRGFTNLTIFEGSDAVSGVWASGYPNFAIQTPGKLYEFSDKELPVPKDYISGPKIQAYCESYMKEHGLNSYLLLNTKVVSMEKTNKNQRKLVTVKSDPNSTKRSESSQVFDFVLLATGIYGPHLKYIPQIPGVEHFKGRVCHSTESTSPLGYDRQGKKVVVVGFGRSAHDCVMNAAVETSVPPILLFRKSHWCVPRKVLGLIPMEWLIYSRFGQGTLPQWHMAGPVESFVHKYLSFVIWVYWRIVEFLFTVQLGMYGSKHHLRPTIDIETDMYAGHGLICHPQMFPMIYQGKIQAVQSSIQRVLPSGDLQLANGDIVQADEIVFATGYKRAFDFLPREVMDKYESDGFYTYRHMILPGVPNFAFLNSNVTTFSNITTPGLQAAWIAALLRGDIQLPSESDLQDQVQTERSWRREHLTDAGASRAYFVQLHQMRYWDTLLSDMGINVKRKQSFLGPVVAALKTFFAPLCSADYKDVITGEWRNHKKQVKTPGYTPSFAFEWSVLGGLVAVTVALCSI